MSSAQSWWCYTCNRWCKAAALFCPNCGASRASYTAEATGAPWRNTDASWEWSNWNRQPSPRARRRPTSLRRQPGGKQGKSGKPGGGKAQQPGKGADGPLGGGSTQSAAICFSTATTPCSWGADGACNRIPANARSCGFLDEPGASSIEDACGACGVARKYASGDHATPWTVSGREPQGDGQSTPQAGIPSTRRPEGSCQNQDGPGGLRRCMGLISGAPRPASGDSDGREDGGDPRLRPGRGSVENPARGIDQRAQPPHCVTAGEPGRGNHRRRCGDGKAGADGGRCSARSGANGGQTRTATRGCRSQGQGHAPCHQADPARSRSQRTRRVKNTSQISLKRDTVRRARSRKSQTGREDEAPWLSPCTSLRGLHGHQASTAQWDVQWTHSIQYEDDFIDELRAQLLGVVTEHAVRFDLAGFSLVEDVDPRTLSNLRTLCTDSVFPEEGSICTEYGGPHHTFDRPFLFQEQLPEGALSCLDNVATQSQPLPPVASKGTVHFHRGLRSCPQRLSSPAPPAAPHGFLPARENFLCATPGPGRLIP